MPIQSKNQRSLRSIIYLTFSLSITIGIFSYLFSHLSLAEVVNLMKNCNRKGLTAFFLLAVCMNIFRTWRYKLILRISGHHPGWLPMFLVVLIRNLFSDLLPARMGTLVYIYIVTTRLGIPFGAAAASFTLSFIFDLIALVPLILVAVLVIGISTNLAVIPILAGMIILAVTAGLILYTLPRLFHLITLLLGKITSHSKNRFQKISLAWTSAETEIKRVTAAGIYRKLFFLSLLVRISKYISLYFLLFALIVPLGYKLADLNLARVFIGLCSSELAASLPISGIAGFGIYEGTWALIFQLLGFPGQLAKLTSISHHLFSQIYGYGLGVTALIILMLPIFKNEPPRPGKDNYSA